VKNSLSAYHTSLQKLYCFI